MNIPDIPEFTARLKKFVRTLTLDATVRVEPSADGIHYYIFIDYPECERGYEIASEIRTALGRHFHFAILKHAEREGNCRTCTYLCRGYIDKTLNQAA